MKGDIVFDGYRPGVIGQIIGLHMQYYTPHWNFGLQFEAGLARDMGAFFPRFDATRDFFVAAYDSTGNLIGAIALDGIDLATSGAHLRWFITSDAMRGRGLGRELMKRVDTFLRENRYDRVWLTTFAGLDAARKLYEDFGFRLTVEEASDPWSGTVGLQRFERG